MTTKREQSEPKGALAGIRIIDLTQMLAGSYGTMILADHGADVIKIESPEGDMVRPVGPYRKDDSEKILGGFFQSLNRNKRSVVLNLKKPEGRAALLKLVAGADAVVENFRAGVMERLGLSYETLQKVNPRLVYGALRGFGDRRTGVSPYSDWPSFDVVAQAMGGIMSITGPDAETPMKVGPGVGDIVPGMMLGFGILAAIFNARQTGEGQFVDVAMVDSVFALCERIVYQHSITGETPRPDGNQHPFMVPFGSYPVADGFVALAAHPQPFFETLCKSINADEVMADPRFATTDSRVANRLALIKEVSRHTARFTKAELTKRLGGRIPFGLVMDMAEIRNDPHFAARDMIVSVDQPGAEPIQIAGVPIKMSKTPGAVRHRAPLLGENTLEELRRAGLSESEIQDLLDKCAAVAAHERKS